jgi:hypothetical protein
MKRLSIDESKVDGLLVSQIKGRNRVAVMAKGIILIKLIKLPSKSAPNLKLEEA